jgi:hypothetical protein
MDIPPELLIVPYKGIKFDTNGENELVARYSDASAEGQVLHNLSLRASVL